MQIVANATRPNRPGLSVTRASRTLASATFPTSRRGLSVMRASRALASATFSTSRRGPKCDEGRPHYFRHGHATVRTGAREKGQATARPSGGAGAFPTLSFEAIS